MKRAFFFVLLCAACGGGQPEESLAEREGASKADGTGWCHANVDSTGGTRMVFDYQVGNDQRHGSLTYAGHVWLNVRNDAFQPTDSAIAVVVVYSYPGPCSGNPYACGWARTDKVYNVKLRYENGRFTAPLENLPMFGYPEGTDGSDSTAYYWELAVVVNGTWYKDPGTGNNLSVIPAHLPGYCGQGTSL